MHKKYSINNTASKIKITINKPNKPEISSHPTNHLL